MRSAAEHIEDAIKDLEGERDRIISAIGDLRTTLARMNNGTVLQSNPTGERKGFERKYDQTARDLIERVFAEGTRPLHIGQIREILRSRGYEFKRATVAVNVKHLFDDNAIRQVKAPRGSGYSYAYVKVSDGQSEQGSLPLGQEG